MLACLIGVTYVGSLTVTLLVGDRFIPFLGAISRTRTRTLTYPRPARGAAPRAVPCDATRPPRAAAHLVRVRVRARARVLGFSGFRVLVRVRVRVRVRLRVRVRVS